MQRTNTLCSAVQRSAAQCSAVQCSTEQCSTVQYRTVQYSAVQYSVVQCSAVQCSAVQCSTEQCSTVQCSAVHYIPLAFGSSRSAYRSVINKLLTNVDFPNPLSPTGKTNTCQSYRRTDGHKRKTDINIHTHTHLQSSIDHIKQQINFNPLLARN